MGNDGVVLYVSIRHRCSLPRRYKVREKGFESVGKDFGDCLVGYVK